MKHPAVEDCFVLKCANHVCLKCGVGVMFYNIECTFIIVAIVIMYLFWQVSDTRNQLAEKN